MSVDVAHEPTLEEWADRHPVASGVIAVAMSGALTVASASELIERPTVGKAATTIFLGLITAAGAVETARPNTFRLWERMEAWSDRN